VAEILLKRIILLTDAFEKFIYVNPDEDMYKQEYIVIDNMFNRVVFSNQYIAGYLFDVNYLSSIFTNSAHDYAPRG
jgi:hypothetical protein